ncbi:MAG: hypothetical protein J6K86_04580 [Clostridia bacterium]|nr:hypothetical protein [Clostridia bacterium]
MELSVKCFFIIEFSPLCYIEKGSLTKSCDVFATSVKEGSVLAVRDQGGADYDDEMIVFSSPMKER